MADDQPPPILDQNGQPVDSPPPILDASGQPISAKSNEPFIQVPNWQGVKNWLSTGNPKLSEQAPNIQGPGMMQIPGVSSAGKAIENKLIGTGNYYAGALGGLIGYGSDVLAGGIDPRAVATGKLPEIAAENISPSEPIKPNLTEPVTQQKLLPAASTGPQLPARLGDSGDIYTGTGKPAELLKPNSIEPLAEVPNTVQKIARHLDSNPVIKNGDLPKPPIDTAVSNKPPSQPSDAVIPGPGQAEPLTPFRADFNSPNKVGMRYESTQPIVEAIVGAKDAKTKWIATTNRELLDTTKGLDKSGRLALWSEIREPGTITDPEIIKRASQAHNILDSIFKEASDSGSDIHYMNDYITEIQKQPEGIKSAIKSIFDFHGMGELFKSVESEPTGEMGDYFEKGMGHPSSVFTRPREGNLNQLEMDPNKIFPIYIDSIAKVIHDAPAVEAATRQLKNVPDGPLKELMSAYIKNYTNYSSEAALHGAWSKFSNFIATTSARSLLGFNPFIHMLHLGEIPANIWPELGTKYTGIGAMRTVTQPIQNFREMSRLGLLQGEIRPFSFKTPAEKLDSIINFMGATESVVKGIAYNGFKRKFLDMGMSENDAVMKALNEAKNATMTVDSARQMKGFTRLSNYIGGEYGARNSMQFKQIPAKIVEQYYNIASQFKKEPMKATRAIFGAGIAGSLSYAGLHTMHNPLTTLPGMLVPTTTVAIKVLTDLAKFDIPKALMDTAAWMTPGGNTLKNMISENEPPKRLQFTA